MNKRGRRSRKGTTGRSWLCCYCTIATSVLCLLLLLLLLLLWLVVVVVVVVHLVVVHVHLIMVMMLMVVTLLLQHLLRPDLQQYGRQLRNEARQHSVVEQVVGDGGKRADAVKAE